jgi:long-chain acyl-CoA synthetase
MYLTQGIHRSVQVNGNRTATSFNGRKRTWSEVAERIARLAGVLRAFGVGPGDRVSMLAHNSDRYIEYYYAVFWLGAVAVPINTRWSIAEIQYSLDDATPAVLLFDQHFSSQAATLRESPGSLHHFIFAGEGDGPEWAQDYEGLIAGAAPVDDIRHGGAALAAIMYTGGTTGIPKGIMLSHDGLALNNLATAAALRNNLEAVTLHAAPMFHLASAATVFMVTAFGGVHSIVPGFVPSLVCGAIAADQVDHLLLVPTMLKMLLDHQEAHGGDLSSVRSLSYGASPMPEVLLRRAIEKLPGVRLSQAFGQTELSPVATMLGAEQHVLEGPDARLLRAAGRALPGVDLKVAGDDGTELARRQVGEVWVRGPNVMLGYWNKPELTAATIVDGWVRTGDAGYMDEDGFLFIVDRVKDMIISGGENIFSAEVENVVLQHPAIAECAIIGVPDDNWGERVHAIVVPKPEQSVTLEMLSDHCRALIASYKCPRSLDVRSAPLPLSAAGKVLKAELRAPFWANS